MAGEGIGRVVLNAKRIPVAFPVNLAVLDEDVVFVTDPGTKLSAAMRGDVVTVEADHVDRMYHTGWSVLVTGMAELVTDPELRKSALRALGSSWVAKRKPTVVRVLATLVSGRRIGWDEVVSGSAPKMRA